MTSSSKIVVSEQQKQRRVLASERHKARHYAMQAIYQWQMSSTTAHDIEAQFRADFGMKGVDIDYFRELVKAVQMQSEQFDSLLAPHAVDKVLSECDPVTLSLLRIATFELEQRIDVPYRVVIDEAVKLAKKFGPEDSHSFVNAVLDKLARQLRVTETNAQR